jgi:hypothetical protein
MKRKRSQKRVQSRAQGCLSMGPRVVSALGGLVSRGLPVLAPVMAPQGDVGDIEAAAEEGLEKATPAV